MQMRVFWMPSSLNRDLVKPSGWPAMPTIQSPGALPADATAVIAEIRCQADADRAADFLESIPRATSLWIYDSTVSVESSVAWIKARAAHLIMRADDPHCLDFLADQSGIHSSQPLSDAMRGVQAAIAMVASRGCNVLIQGETGTGKEVAARELHAAGDRSRGPWVAVNCTAIPEPLLEAELFGYHKGAFTGAI